MPTTPVLALPYPNATDTADVPRDIQALAVKLDAFTSLSPPLVSSLPGSPVDGQECYFLADATLGVVWHLRYRAASAFASKWELVGGTPLRSQVAANESPGTAAAWIDLATVGPQVTIPLKGEYDIEWGAKCVAAGINVQIHSGVAVATGTPPAPTSTISSPATATGWTGAMYAMSMQVDRRAFLAGDAVRQRYYSTATTLASISDRWLRARPVRVG